MLFRSAPEQKGFLFFPKTTGLDGTKVGAIQSKAETELTAAEKSVRAAVIHGGRMSLKWTALVPLAMAVGYLLLILYFKARGGYKQVHIEGADATQSNQPPVPSL